MKSANSTSTEKQRKQQDVDEKKRVSFDCIEIHEHPYKLGDNPSVSRGAPLTIAWKQQDYAEVGIDEYEYQRPSRKYRNQLKLSVLDRSHL
jgi:hypothetical protein